jgi:hypothetical protein
MSGSKAIAIGYSCFLLSLAIGASVAEATTTVCSEQASKAHHYGQKATVKFQVPSVGPDSITELVKAFAAKGELSYSSVGGFDRYEQPELRSLCQILQSRSNDVALTIRTTNRNAIADAEISMFSLSCGATEDWQPYWRKFLVFISAQQYLIIQE